MSSAVRLSLLVSFYHPPQVPQTVEGWLHKKGGLVGSNSKHN